MPVTVEPVMLVTLVDDVCVALVVSVVRLTVETVDNDDVVKTVVLDVSVVVVTVVSVAVRDVEVVSVSVEHKLQVLSHIPAYSPQPSQNSVEHASSHGSPKFEHVALQKVSLMTFTE